MSAKETVLAAVRAMPDETTTEEILRRLSELMSSAIKKPNSPARHRTAYSDGSGAASAGAFSYTDR